MTGKRGGGEGESDGAGGGGEDGNQGAIGQAERKGEGGGVLREGREGGRGRKALRGTRVARGGGCGRRCALAPRVPGCRARDSGAAAAAAPGRAALALLREVARRAKEGRARAVGRGDYAISERRIGCIQSQSGCKLTAGPRSRGVQGDRGVGGS